MLAAAALATALQPAEVEAQREIEAVFTIPARTTLATYFDADEFVM
jgi:hypothetical protein